MAGRHSVGLLMLAAVFLAACGGSVTTTSSSTVLSGEATEATADSTVPPTTVPPTTVPPTTVVVEDEPVDHGRTSFYLSSSNGATQTPVEPKGLVGTPTTRPPATTTTQAPPTTTQAPIPGSSETVAFTNKINQLRVGVGLNALQRHGDLDRVAQLWADTMASSRWMRHSDAVSTMIYLGWWTAGENVGYGPDPSSIFNGLVDSPSHYDNMVNPAYTHMGIGTAWSSQGELFTAHVFGG